MNSIKYTKSSKCVARPQRLIGQVMISQWYSYPLTDMHISGVTSLPLYDRFLRKAREFPNALVDYIQKRLGGKDRIQWKPSEEDALLDLLKKMLALNPHDRITVGEAFTHEFFYDTRKRNYMDISAKEELAQKLQKIPDSHEYEQRMRKRNNADRHFA